ncbi:arabinogalactan peptide 23-like [Cucurbita maxima]|uniref:Arabinogalactan peptide 23-like n=1 Tax=Cucurbita maxima TaxID=3661 RepID=A0A6J1IYE9_CUCMA|nr:arabinogalactan peptide 23-like [Cucurbita maxima]
MEMKNIACTALFTAAAVTAVVASDESHSPAAAPGPSSAASAALPALGSLIGASLVSFVAYVLN